MLFSEMLLRNSFFLSVNSQWSSLIIKTKSILQNPPMLLYWPMQKKLLQSQPHILLSKYHRRPGQIVFLKEGILTCSLFGYVFITFTSHFVFFLSPSFSHLLQQEQHQTKAGIPVWFQTTPSSTGKEYLSNCFAYHRLLFPICLRAIFKYFPWKFLLRSCSPSVCWKERGICWLVSKYVLLLFQLRNISNTFSLRLWGSKNKGKKSWHF